MDKDIVFCRDDLVRGGLCIEGIEEVASRLWPVPSAIAVSEIMPKLDRGERAQVRKALDLDGFGDGSSYGYSYGYGYGCSDGYGDGCGDGYGYGDGDGSGNGYGDGFSYGDED